MQNLINDLRDALKNDERLIIDGKLVKNKIVELALSMDEGLITLLLSNKTIKKHFFKKIADVLVFDKVAFQSFISNKQFLPDSYTAFKNKIGLTANGEYLTESKEVVLTWPYKDCVLEGGQTKEDQKRKEIFWNETLAPDEIDRLLAPKALTNFKKYDKDGEHEVDNISLDDNLIVKGNNLLALHSLKKKYSGQVKLIYIDPPYNTGSDSFGYNDSFNHSTWLTFMKNRLELSRQLLNKQGVIFIHCDNNEQAYLKVLLDSVFGVNNFIDTITVVNNPRGRDYGGIANMHEFIHIYSKSEFDYEMHQLTDPDKEFPFKDKISPYETRELRNRNTAFNDKNRPNLCYPFYVNPNKEIDNGFLELSIDKKDGFIEVWPAKSQGIQTVWRWGKPKSLESLNIDIVGKAMQEAGRYMIVEKYRKNSRLARSVWWDKDVNSERGTVHLRELFGKKVFGFPKPETLISRIIEISTNENDIVLDYHLGSGTTASTAHKMNRKYVGIEQMSYVETIAVNRLRKVIEGEKGGISKSVDWQGGGSFIYCELTQHNANIIDKIEKADTTETLISIWQEIEKTDFISYKIKPETINKNIGEFEALSLEEQKQFLISVLDKNQLYVNYSDIDDEDYQVSETEKKLNKQFYGEV